MNNVHAISQKQHRDSENERDRNNRTPPLKALELTLRVRNNQLKGRRIALGMTQRKLAAAAGVVHGRYCGLESMHDYPQIRVNERWQWRNIVIKLAHFHRVEPEELFPPAVLAVETPVAVRQVDPQELALLFGSDQEQRLLDNPENVFLHNEQHERLQDAIASLPEREAKVLRLRFGLEDGVEWSLEAVGAEFGVCRGRAQQLEMSAIRKLRHPNRGFVSLDESHRIDDNDRRIEIARFEKRYGKIIHQEAESVVVVTPVVPVRLHHFPGPVAPPKILDRPNQGKTDTRIGQPVPKHKNKTQSSKIR